jgi:hypothetical protein
VKLAQSLDALAAGSNFAIDAIDPSVAEAGDHAET